MHHYKKTIDRKIATTYYVNGATVTSDFWILQKDGRLSEVSMGTIRYEVTFRNEKGDAAKDCIVAAGSQTDAYWNALGHAIEAGLWPKCLFMRVRVKSHG
jgi:hypothetical protein